MSYSLIKYELFELFYPIVLRLNMLRASRGLNGSIDHELQ